MEFIKPISSFFLFILLCGNVAAQEISMFSGLFGNTYYQDDKKITKSELRLLLEKDTEAYKYWKRSRLEGTIAYAALGAEIGIGIWGIGEARRRREVPTEATIGVLGSATLAIVFAMVANNSRKKSVLTYNKGLEEKTTFRLAPISNQNGLGLAFKF